MRPKSGGLSMINMFFVLFLYLSQVLFIKKYEKMGTTKLKVRSLMETLITSELAIQITWTGQSKINSSGKHCYIRPSLLFILINFHFLYILFIRWKDQTFVFGQTRCHVARDKMSSIPEHGARERERGHIRNTWLLQTGEDAIRSEKRLFNRQLKY